MRESNVIGNKRKWLILSTTSLGVFMSTLDASIVNIALPNITAHFQAPLGSVEWVVMVYLLVMSSLFLTFGRLGDMYGHRPVYLSGFTLFTAASYLCSRAGNIQYLIAARAVQALGAAMVISVVQAIIADTFGVSERGKAIGLNSMFVSLGLATGPTFGGLLVGSFGWQSIFYINIPIGILGIIWAWNILPKKSGSKQHFDLGGAVFVFITLVTFLLAMSHGQAWGWKSPAIISLFSAALVFFAVFIFWEQHVKCPMLSLKLFRNRLFSAANLTAVFNYLTQYAVIFLMPFYLVNILQMPFRQAGLVMTVFPLVMMITSPISGSLSDRVSSRILSSFGMGVIAVGVFLLSNIYRINAFWPVIVGLILVGFGTGFFLSPNNNAIISNVPKDMVGIGSGMIATMRCVGQVMGIAVSGAVFSSRLAYYTADLVGRGYSYQQGFLLAQHDAYLIATIFAIAGMVVSLAREPRSKSSAGK